MRRDGFAGLTPEVPGGSGTFVTKGVRLEGEELFLNVEPRDAGGIVEVGVMGGDGDWLPGFSPEEAEPMSGDSVRRRARWRSGKTVGALRGRSVRFVVRLRGEVMVYALALEARATREAR